MNKTLSRSLRQYTSARVGLNRAGRSLATHEVLDFQLAHAQARDAVHATLDVPYLLDGLRERKLPACVLRSAAADRDSYLRHPDLGRRLNQESGPKLVASPCDIAFVITDGLSALAVTRHALLLLDAILPLLLQEWSVGPICVVEQGRVAIGDSIGNTLQAKVSVVLIGERPGLSSPDSLGAYITWDPHPGRTDAERNCISNIRPEGLEHSAAARMLAFYLHEALRLKLTGVNLKLVGDVQRGQTRSSLPDAET